MRGMSVDVGGGQPSPPVTGTPNNSPDSPPPNDFLFPPSPSHPPPSSSLHTCPLLATSPTTDVPTGSCVDTEQKKAENPIEALINTPLDSTDEQLIIENTPFLNDLDNQHPLKLVFEFDSNNNINNSYSNINLLDDNNNIDNNNNIIINNNIYNNDIINSNLLINNNNLLNNNNNNNNNNNTPLDDTNKSVSEDSSHVLLPATTITFPQLSYLAAEADEMEGQMFLQKNPVQSRRIVFKDGSCNVTTSNINERRKKYLVDIFTTLVDMKWRYNCLMFVSGFVGSWLFFSLLYFVAMLLHEDHLHRLDTDWQPCFSNVYDFYSAFLFSLETQQTIGYGFRGMEVHCPFSVGILMVQCCVGVFIQSLTAGIIFAKLSQPKRRAHTLLFSRRAVICLRDGEYCLLFRVGNMRKSHFVGTSIRAFIVQDKFTKEGECIPLWQNPLQIQAESCNDDDSVFLVWPVTIVHKITPLSPLWRVTAGKLLEEHFEIIVVLEGVVESTGMTTQVRTSYLNTEILWAHRLAPLLTYQKDNGQYKIDYSQFHAVIPTCSMNEESAAEHQRKRVGLDDDDISKITEMETFNFGYISPEAYPWKPDNWKANVFKRVGLRLKSKSFKRDLPSLNRRMSASTSALRVFKSRNF